MTIPGRLVLKLLCFLPENICSKRFLFVLCKLPCYVQQRNRPVVYQVPSQSQRGPCAWVRRHSHIDTRRVPQLEIYRRPQKFSPPANKDYQSPSTIAGKLLIPFCRGTFREVSFDFHDKGCLTSSVPYRGPSHATLFGSLWFWLNPLSKQMSMHQKCYMQVLSTANLEYTVW